MKIINKDILTVDKGIICHQVNCQKTMGSGLAKQIRDKWPNVYEQYLSYSNRFSNNFELLGMTQGVYVSKDLMVCNIFGQLNYGYDGKRYTDYGALNCAFNTILGEKNESEQVYFPLNFGCDRGGADWNIVSKMIDFYFPNAIVCKL